MFRSRTRFNRRIAIALIAFHVAGLASSAAPLGGTVVSGQADITAAGGITQIRQQTDRAVINWQSFSSQAGEAVRFQQPSATSVTLNRVVTLDPSVLNGSLTANGRLFLINPNGIVFGPTSQVNVGSLVASTLSISDHDFQRGNYRLVQAPDRPLASIINQGKITAAPGGMVALVAPVVNNQGEIVAAAGRVVLAGGAAAKVDLDAGLVSLDVPAAPPRDVVVGTDGAANPLAEAVNNRALVEAGSVTEQGGKVVLGSAEGLVVNTGRISVDGPSGGHVKLDSTQATIHAGRGVISANATAAGAAGGEIKLLGQKTTAFGRGARIEARGGPGGQGGFAEVSGASIILQGQVDVSAPQGNAGSFLIDPQNLTIVDATGSLDGSAPSVTPGQTSTLEVSACCGGNTISVARLNDIANSAAHVELQVGCSLTFDNTVDIDMRGFDFTIRFVGAGGDGRIQKTTGLGVGALVNAGNVSFIADQTKATAFDLSNLSIGAAGTVLLCAPSILAPPVVRLGRIGTGGGCNPQQVNVNAPGGLIAGTGTGTGTGSLVNISATNVDLDAAQIGTGCTDGVRIDVSGTMKLKADDAMFVANDVVPVQLDVTLDQSVACQVRVRMGGGCANSLRVCNDGRIRIDAATGLDVLLDVTRGGDTALATGFGTLNVGPGGALGARVTGEVQFHGTVAAPGGRIGFRATRYACLAGACGGIFGDRIALDADDSIGFGVSGDAPLAFAATTALELSARGQKLNATLATVPAGLSIEVNESTEVSLFDTAGAALVSRAPQGAFFVSLDGNLSLEVLAGDLVSGGIDVGDHEVVLTAFSRLLALPGTRIAGDRVSVCAPNGVGGSPGCATAPVVDIDANVLSVTSTCGSVSISDPDSVFVDQLDALGSVELTVGGRIETDVAGITGASIDVRATGDIAGAYVATNFVALTSTNGCVGTVPSPVLACAGNAVALASFGGGIVAFVDGASPVLDVTVAPGKPVNIRQGSVFGVTLLETDGDFFLQTSGVLDKFLTLRGVTDLPLGDVETSAGFAVNLFAPKGEIRTDRGSTIVAETLFVSTRDGMHAGSASEPTASRVSADELSVAVTGTGRASLLNDGDLTLRAASSCNGSIDVEAQGNLTVDSVSDNQTFGSVTGTVRLAANGITVATCDTILGRRVILEADGRIDVDHLSATERAEFHIGDAGVLLAGLDALPREVRVIQDVASGSDIAVRFGAQFVAGAVGAALSASMAVDLVLAADRGDLRVADIDTLGRDLTLDASRGAIRSQPGSRLRADDVTLIADRGPGAPGGNAIDAVVEARSVSICTRRGDARVQVASPLVDLRRTDVDGDLFVNAAGALGIADDVTATGLVQLTAAGAIADTDPARAKVEGARAELFAGAGVGTPGRPLVSDVGELDVRGGAAGAFVVNDGALRADATAGTDVFVMTRNGDLTVRAVQAGFTAQLVAEGRILDGNGAADNVTLGAGGNLVLRAGSGIGTLANPLEIVTDAVDASTRTGDVALSERDHVLVKAAAGGDVDITARGGYLILDTLLAGGRAALTATIGGILDANGTALNVTARELLIALCDTAGTSADFLEIAVRKLDVTAFGAFVDAQGALEVERLQSTGNSQILAQGDLELGRLESTLGKMDLIAAGGDIVDGNGGAVNLVSGSNGLITLTATGTIGAGNALEVSLTPGFLSVLAGAAQGGVSASIEGDIVPASSVLIVNAPGSVLFRGRVQGNGAVDQGAADRVNAGQVVAGANRAPQSQGSGDGKPQKANELIDTSGVQ